MRWGHTGTVFRKELRETLRDRRTLIVMIVVPVFLYPMLMVVMQQVAVFGQERLEAEPAGVALSGVSAELRAFLEEDTALRIVSGDTGESGAVERGEVDALVAMGDDPGNGQGTRPVTVLFDASDDRSVYARDLVAGRLASWSDTLLARRLGAAGLPRSFARPLAVADSSVATAERVGGSAVGRFLPMILILITLLGAFYPAIDLTAGEKERGTLETLLTTSVPNREIVAGKFLAVFTIALGSAVLNLASMWMTFESGVLQYADAAGFAFSLPLQTAGAVLLLMIPVAVLFAALCLGVAVRAASFKEAQNALTPLQLLVLIPTVLPVMPGIRLTFGLALVPVAGAAVLFRELMSGTAALGPALVALGATAFYALLALRFAVGAFGREEVLFGSGSDTAAGQSLRAAVQGWRGADRPVPLAAESLAFVAGVALLYFYLGVRLQIAGLERGLLAAQWLLLALPALLFVRVGPYRLRSALGLRAAPPRAWLAGAMIIVGGIPVSWLLGWLQSLVLEIPEEFMEGMSRLLTADDPLRFLWLLFLVALTPAICEELVFRGVLLQGLASEMTMSRAVLTSAAVFGAFHLSIETVVRFLPTAWLGALLGYVVWHSRSIFPAMLMHFINNASILALVAATGLQVYLTGPSGEPRWFAVAGGVMSLVAGLALLPKRRPEPGPVVEPSTLS